MSLTILWQVDLDVIVYIGLLNIFTIPSYINHKLWSCWKSNMTHSHIIKASRSGLAITICQRMILRNTNIDDLRIGAIRVSNLC